MESSNSETNTTSLARHILHSFPSLAQRAGLAVIHPLEVIDNIARPLWKGGSIIADATTQHPNTTSFLTNHSTALAKSSTAAAAATPNPTMSELLQESFTQSAQAWREGGGSNNLGFSVSTSPSTASTLLTTLLTNLAKLKDFGGIFTYLTSKWALTTFTVAILLNRTQFYASSRQNLRLPWYVRLALYGVPICLFLVQLGTVLQALRCQTSPDFALLRYGDPLKKLGIDFGGEGGMLYTLSSRLLFWQGSDAEACEAVGFSVGRSAGVGRAEGGMDFRGSLSLLFGFFLTVCTSQFFDTLACTLQGRQPKPETGMTIFEHSLAFAECEAMISSALGLGFLGVARQSDAAGGVRGGTAPLLTRSEILPRLNVPPEVLLVCLISCFSHLSSAVLAVFDIRHRVRLVNTGIWALSYMSAFIWTFCRLFFQSFDGVAELGALRFPTVCMVGFIPHLLILTGITVCGAIYGLALLITALSLPSEPGTLFHHRWNRAYQNLQANVQFSAASSLRIKMSEDFYTALLKIGFNVLTAASEAVYLNEGSRIQVAESTWLERKRMREIADEAELRRANRRRRLPSIPSELLGEDVIARGIDFVDRQNEGEVAFQSPYARERKSKSRKQQPRGQSSGRDGDPAAAAAQGGGEVESGIGITQRRNRAQMTFDFFAGVWGLFGSVLAQGLFRLLGTLGVEPQRCPAWLVKMAGLRDDGQEGREGEGGMSSLQRHPLSLVNLTRNQRDFWMLGPEGRLMIAPNDEVDVEVETRRMLQRSGTYLGEESLGEHVYAWWRRGGWFGSVDGSGDYVGRGETNDDDDEDTTSVLSMSTDESAYDEDEETDSGRRTPTQDDPFGARRFDRELSPATTIATDDSGSALDMAQIARLLNPQTTAERDEARLLSHALLSPRPTTRSQYRLHTARTRSRVLGFRGGEGNPHASSSSGRRNEEQEEEDLEAFLLSQREKKGSFTNDSGTASSRTWQTGAEGLGDSGPQCVVCQSSPRAVLVWPCGCLSLCDECRVGLAARNFTKCICCRTEVGAYSRLFVP